MPHEEAARSGQKRRGHQREVSHQINTASYRGELMESGAQWPGSSPSLLLAVWVTFTEFLVLSLPSSVSRDNNNTHFTGVFGESIS